MLTIFTPTYNRKSLLNRVYEHLCHQTCKDFEWIIVDDGSSDGTSDLVQKWISEEHIQINYHYVTNGGKMRAHNLGVQLAARELFMCLDSDDYLVDSAVEKVIEFWRDKFQDKHIKNIVGIVANKGKDYTHTLNGECFPELEKTNLTDLYNHGFHGETALVYRTEILKRYPFPAFEGETFIPEAVAFDQIDKKFKLFILPQIIMICEYQKDGLSNSIRELRCNNPQGWLLYYQLKIQATKYGSLRYKYIVHAICFSWALKRTIFKAVPAAKIELLAALPAAYVLKIMGRL